jgi:hypothetical protein
MALVLGMLAFAVVLGVNARRLGAGLYVLIFAVAVVAALAFLFLYYRLFF